MALTSILTSHYKHGCAAAQLRPCVRTGASSDDAALVSTPEVFRRLEDLVVRNLNDKDTPGGRLDWESVAGCWVLRPPAGASQAVVVFVGDAFLGTTPSIAHQNFLALFPEHGDVLSH